MIKRSLLVFLIFLCSNNCMAQVSVEGQLPDFMKEYRKSYFSQVFGFEVPKTYNSLLYDTIVTWLGTPYRFAGNGEKGIDCSGFMNVLYDHVMGVKLGARNSGDIYKLVEKVDPDDIREGDFVFFSLRRHRISHIGMYLGNNKFVHSSTSKGVTISDLNEPHYRKYFAGAGRHLSDSLRVTVSPQE